MRIGMILDKPFPPDVRVEKEAPALLRAGFEVGLLSGKSQSAPQAHHVCEDGLHLFRTDVPSFSLFGFSRKPKPKPIAKGLLRWKGYRVRSWSHVLGWEGYHFWRTGVSGDWARAIARFIGDFGPDILHVHDLVLVPTALRVGQTLGLPVVADLHENWPAALAAYRQSPRFEGKQQLFDTWWDYATWQEREQAALSRCAAVICVVPEAAERLYDYGLARDKVVIVSNTEDETAFGKDPPDPEILRRYDGRWVALYIGTVGRARGLDVVIRAVPQVIQQRQDFLFLIVGAKAGWEERYPKMAEELGVGRYVEALGWQPGSTVSSYIAASEVGLVPHRSLEHTNTTVPHKLFQYMLIGKPVVVSDCPPLKRIVQETESGVVFSAGDPESAAQALLKVALDPAAARRYAENARRAAQGPYSWRQDAGRLVDLYRRLEAEI
jgi:glycosyltransferase involved in cell wall biosynthesis